jgi:uncharacterized membrane protein (DUF485 family)
MKTELPVSNDYFRPTRARELQRKAERLDWWYRAVLLAGLVTFNAISAFWMALCLARRDLMATGWVMAAALVWSGACTWIRTSLARQYRQCQEQIAELESEHQTRYGELPAGEDT